MKIKPISDTLAMTDGTRTSRMLEYMNSPQRLTILAAFFATAILSGCTRGANLNVINRSTAELTNVVATGSGFTQSLAEPLLWRIGSIPAGKQHSVSISPRSESDLKLDFDVNGKHFTSKPQGYFEGGKVTAIVATDFSVTVDTN